MVQSMKVAVIGAGMAGLVSARELQREGHSVTIFERTHRVGGVWVYDPSVETDLLGLDPDRVVVHSSMYRSLRTNIPRQLMGFLDYGFVMKEGGGDSRSFPGHEEVLRYLEDFARDFGVQSLVRFGHEVVSVEPVNEAAKTWVVGWKTGGMEVEIEEGDEMFEAVVVCNGKYTEPRIADFPGRDTWPGIQMHSHNYRTPEPLKNKIVVVIGNGTSARDILTEISGVAREVYQVIRPRNVPGPAVQWVETKWHQYPMIKCAQEDGKVIFQDDLVLFPDVILHCTGYKYSFPFLKTNGRVTVDDNCVGPLYKHVFPPSLAPRLSFVGLAMRIVPNIVGELQAKWVARALSGKVSLPTEEEMMSSDAEYIREMEKNGIPKHQAHIIRQEKCDYETWLVAQSGEPPMEKWKAAVSFSTFVKILSEYGTTFRDAWDVDKWIKEFEEAPDQL